jgi:neutral ceramidase
MNDSRASLFAGASVVDITPHGSVFLYGYPHVRRYSTGIHDPLQCAALYLRQGNGQVLFLANDVIYFPRPFVAEVRQKIHEQTGLPASCIMITATHTHSGPIMADHLSNAADPVVPKVDESYLAWLSTRLVEAAVSAVRSAVPAEAGLSVARAVGVGSNRHNPAGPADPEVPVLIVRRADTQTPIACMLVYGMHPTVLHEDSTLLSGDFPAFTRQFLRQCALPSDCPVLFHNGASGDQSPRHVTRANTFAEARRLGELLGHAVAQVIPDLSFHHDLPIAVRTQFLPLVARAFPALAQAELDVATAAARFESLKAQGAARQLVRTAECDVFGAAETAELSRASADGRLAAAIAHCTPAEIQLIELGPWKFVGWPGEHFVAYGLELKRRLPGSFLITLANGELQGYIVTAEAAEAKVYESTNAVFAPENGPRFIEATVALAHASDSRR